MIDPKDVEKRSKNRALRYPRVSRCCRLHTSPFHNTLNDLSEREMGSDHVTDGASCAHSLSFAVSLNQFSPFTISLKHPKSYQENHLDSQRYTGRFSCPSCWDFSGHERSWDPAFINKRNERERQRVRCVNEGYARLRRHLPQEFEEKRLSKVETLRAAIRYIKDLQTLLDVQTRTTLI